MCNPFYRIYVFGLTRHILNIILFQLIITTTLFKITKYTLFSLIYRVLLLTFVSLKLQSLYSFGYCHYKWYKNNTN